MQGHRRSVLALTVVVMVVLAIWSGGWLATRLGARKAPWIVPWGIALSGEPEIGIAYNVTVYTHCGLRHVEFDDDTWAISGVLTGCHANPPPGFGNAFDHGTMTLMRPDTAVYHSGYGEQRQLTRGGGLPAVDCL